MSDVTQTQLEKQSKSCDNAIANMEVAKKLYNNRDFKKLILDEFCVKECARYAQASANPALTKEAREDSLAMAQAAGHLRRFMEVTIQKGIHAQSEKEKVDDILAQIAAGVYDDPEDDELDC